MDSLTDTVRQTALNAGADLVGFAPIERFDNAPPELHPRTIFPGAKTVVAMAMRQLRGALKAAEEGTYWQAYNCDSYWYLNEVAAPAMLRAVVLLLEKHGYTSVPIHNPFHSHTGKQLREDQPAGPDGMVSLRIIGVAAGLGELGRSKLLLTPQFGPRQRVFAVFTDAVLAPTPLMTTPVCDDCGQCAEHCQANAIGHDRDVKLDIGGHTFSHCRFDDAACAPVHNGSDLRFNPFVTGKEAPGEQPSYSKFLDQRFRHRSICVGRGCLRACLDHLEKTGRIQARFKTPLVERPRWTIPQPPPAEKTD